MNDTDVYEGLCMIKYLALGVISVIVSTFSACVLKNLRGKPSTVKDGDGYGFYLGCAWFVTAVISGVISAVSGHLLIGITYFLLSLCGVASVVFSVFYGGGHHKISNDAAETSSCDSGKEQFGSEKQGENNVSYRQKICPETATDDRSCGVFADLYLWYNFAFVSFKRNKLINASKHRRAL